MIHPSAIRKLNAGRVGAVLELNKHSSGIDGEHGCLGALMPRAAVVVGHHVASLESRRCHAQTLPARAGSANYNRRGEFQ